VRGTAHKDNKYLLCSAQFLELQCNQIHSYRLVEEWISTLEGFGVFGRSPTIKRGQCATRNGPQVTTKFGGVLRATSVDELPQFFNVLLGDMSLVGPRSHGVAHHSHYGKLLSDCAFRHHVKPAITGWTQIRGCCGETA
jgi:Bacterial sugar transferase